MLGQRGGCTAYAVNAPSWCNNSRPCVPPVLNVCLLCSEELAADARAGGGLADDGDGSGKTAQGQGQGRQRTAQFRVTVTDNGSGMEHDDIPNMLGRGVCIVLYCIREPRHI
jgi:hypothetical protein